MGRAQPNRNSSAKDLSSLPSEGVFLSIYKSKVGTFPVIQGSTDSSDKEPQQQDDLEPIQQHSITSIADCQIQMLAHKKQGPVLPTLVINIIPDPMLDKLRKRRSSRTTGFTAPKDNTPTTLLFRPGDEQYSLQNWASFIQQLIQPNVPDRTPLSPVTPASPSFINPFAPRPRDPSDMQNRPDSGNGSSRQAYYFKGTGHTHSIRDRPLTFSDSPSLRSKRSDLSSQTSSMNQPHVGFHSYNTMVPADLPSPATTIGEYQGEFIEGWTSAQGRSSALNSPVRGRDSVSSQPTAAPLPPIPDATIPPGPRETILDRAFQMRRIPGSETEVPGEEKLSSLARFDALMREMDEKRRQRETQEAKLRGETAAAPTAKPEDSKPQSAWEEDDSDSDGDSDDSDDSEGPIGEVDRDIEDRYSGAPAQRALDYIAGRYPHSRSHGMRSPPTYNHEALMALSSGPSALRPHTGYSKNRARPGMAQRTHSQPHLATILASQTPLDGDAEEGSYSLGPASPPPLGRHRSSTCADKRQSTSSAKRLSFSEFTRRLSSTSSLLLVQTNASGGSSRCSNSDMDLPQIPQSPPQPLHHLHPRAGLAHQQQQQQQLQQQQTPQSPPPVSERDRCGWRGSAVFGGGDGGFL